MPSLTDCSQQPGDKNEAKNERYFLFFSLLFWWVWLGMKMIFDVSSSLFGAADGLSTNDEDGRAECWAHRTVSSHPGVRL